MSKLLILLCLFFIYSCGNLSGHLGASKTIEDSKERGVFVVEYKPLSNPVIISDSIRFKVKKV
jgi:hypothetical protein